MRKFNEGHVQQLADSLGKSSPYSGLNRKALEDKASDLLYSAGMRLETEGLHHNIEVRLNTKTAEFVKLIAEDADVTGDQAASVMLALFARKNKLAEDKPKPANPVGIPGNFITHRNAWRDALQKAYDAAMEAHDGDNASYWAHELVAFDESFDRLWAHMNCNE